ncbi:MAG TPA: biopolymer transporter ExbD [Nitrospiraceae bacterium]|nr:biopolymer transporter ExbD [Nitrospiraceae bacterium]
MKLRRSRQFRRGRIEIIPMIDVMFFLLATFMLASLALQNLHSLPVNLPRGKAAPMQARSPVTLTVTKDKAVLLDSTPVTLETLARTLQPMLKVSDGHIIVAADSAAPEGLVVQAMLQARRAGAEHFLIAVKYSE